MGESPSYHWGGLRVCHAFCFRRESVEAIKSNLRALQAGFALQQLFDGDGGGWLAVKHGAHFALG